MNHDPEILIQAAWNSLDDVQQATDYDSFRMGFLKALLMKELGLLSGCYNRGEF